MIWRIGEPSQRYVRVLLVDDDEDDALLARELLSEAEHVRFAVTWARDAEQALTLLGSETFDAVLLDLRLGPASGLDVLAQARAGGARMPIVMLTGANDHEIDMRAMEAGADDYLVKGRLDATLLERTLRYAIAHHRARLELEERARELEAANAALEDTRGLLEDSNARLAATVKRQNELLGMAAHDLRNPLGIVLSYAALLEEEAGSHTGEDRLAIVRRIQSSVRFMIAMIDDLLDLSAIATGTLTLDLARDDLADIVRRTVEPMAMLAAPKRITIEVSAPAEPMPVRVDPRRMEQVVQNLVGNAIKYSHAGSAVQVRVDASATKASFSVVDRGVGIAHSFRDRLFAPFAKGQAGTEGEKSVGLGLAIVRRIVDAHGGTIELESAPGVGSTFRVEVPRAK